MPSGSDTTEEAVSGTSPDGPVPAAEQGATALTARPRRARRLAALVRREALRTGLAVVCGLALGLAFPPYDLWPLSLAAVAALSLLTRGRSARQGAWTGFVFGLPFFLILLKWLHVVGWDAVVGLSVAEALFMMLLGAGLAVTSRLPLWPLWTACLWVTEEWARDRLPFGGFPWGGWRSPTPALRSPRSPRSAAPRW